MKGTEARLDMRLLKHQKEFFERAATIGGFRTLTEFVIYSMQDKAKEIMEEHNRVLASEKDQEVFFDALLGQSEPNEVLKKAAGRYKKALKK